MIAITASHCANAGVCGTLRERTMRIEGKYYEFINDIGNDVKLNLDATNFAIKHHTVFCMVEITLKSSLRTSSNYIANMFVGVSIS